MLTEILQQNRKILLPNISRRDDNLHIAAARRDPLFISVTCEIVKNSDKDIHDLLHDLAQDEMSDDTIVRVI